MNRHKLPAGLRKYIREQKKEIRRNVLYKREADEKIREFLSKTVKGFKKTDG